MKQRVLIIGGIIVTVVMLSRSGVADALLIFLLAGAVPGTTISLPAGIMLVTCGVVALALTFRYTAISLIDALDLHRMTRKHLAYRERMPKRRFTQITRPQA